MMWLMALGCVWLVTFFVLVWWIAYKYLGSSAATFITIIVISLSVLALNSWLNEPSEQELKTFQEKRKGVGY